ncbi:MAG: sugar O-acetyltransferase [Eubacterium sp.]
MTEKEKMISGKLYDPSDKELEALRLQAHRLSKDYNDTYEDEEEKREEILSKLIPNRSEGVYIQGPIQFDYGVFTTLGKNFYANFNLTVLDVCPVTIGDNVLIGPNCSIMTPVHPFRYQDRNIRQREDGSLYDYEYAKPITIKENCWLAANVTVCGGVTINEGCVIGAGSVVTRDIPPNSLAAGNPCKVIREITEDDAIELKKELF